MQTVKILVVEDEPIIAADLEDRLTDMGYLVMGTPAAGETALEMLEQQQPDLILMDVTLEGELTGTDTSRIIREKYNIPIIYLTSNTDKATFEQARTTRPEAYLSKPFRGRDLQNAIELALLSSVEPKAATPVMPAPQLTDRIFVKDKNRMVCILIKDVLWAAADDYYCKLHTAEKGYLLSMTLKKFQEKITSPDLFRIHRSYVVNLRQIKEIGDVYVHFQQQKIPIGKSYRAELFERLQQL
ncbi:MAG: response regulator [Bacteroidota bacterium]